MGLTLRSRLARVAAVVWLLAAFALLLVMVLRPELQTGERRALSTLVPLYFMSLPLGHAGLALINKVKLELYLADGYVPGILVEGVALWAALTLLGYLQWCLLLPLACERIRRWRRAAIE